MKLFLALSLSGLALEATASPIIIPSSTSNITAFNTSVPSDPIYQYYQWMNKWNVSDEDLNATFVIQHGVRATPCSAVWTDKHLWFLRKKPTFTWIKVENGMETISMYGPPEPVPCKEEVHPGLWEYSDMMRNRSPIHLNITLPRRKNATRAKRSFGIARWYHQTFNVTGVTRWQHMWGHGPVVHPPAVPENSTGWKQPLGHGPVVHPFHIKNKTTNHTIQPREPMALPPVLDDTTGWRQPLEHVRVVHPIPIGNETANHTIQPREPMTVVLPPSPEDVTGALPPLGHGPVVHPIHLKNKTIPQTNQLREPETVTLPRLPDDASTWRKPIPESGRRNNTRLIFEDDDRHMSNTPVLEDRSPGVNKPQKHSSFEHQHHPRMSGYHGGKKEEIFHHLNSSNYDKWILETTKKGHSSRIPAYEEGSPTLRWNASSLPSPQSTTHAGGQTTTNNNSITPYDHISNIAARRHSSHSSHASHENISHPSSSKGHPFKKIEDDVPAFADEKDTADDGHHQVDVHMSSDCHKNDPNILRVRGFGCNDRCFELEYDMWSVWLEGVFTQIPWAYMYNEPHCGGKPARETLGQMGSRKCRANKTLHPWRSMRLYWACPIT